MSIVTCRSHLPCGAPQHPKGQSAGNLFNYIGGTTGSWRVTKVVTHSGQTLKPASHVEIVNGCLSRRPAKSAWVLRTVARSTRYITREEPRQLESFQRLPYGTDSPFAGLILVRKSAAWWSLAQDEQREIIEKRANQITTRLRFLPAIARRFQFSRNLGEPFDFVTWFEYSAQDTSVFDELTGAVRASEEWQYVEREIDIRLIRDSIS